MRLSDLLGHERQRAALHHAHASGTAHHAYLFVGPDGIGKRRAAYGFAALANCTAPTDAGACGVCKHCRRILSVDDTGEPDNAHPDVLALVPDGKQIKIAQVREVLRVVPFPPIEAAFRYVFVDPADLLGEEAANALLKTLEEPPSRTRFILMTSRPAGVLTTIKSRCQSVIFGRLTDAVLVEVLTTRHGLDPDLARRVASLADGSVRAALTLVDDPIMAKRDAFIAAFLNVHPGDVVAAFKFAQRLAELPPEARQTALDLLERLLRDALMISVGAGVPLFNAAARDALTAWAATIGTSSLMARVDLLAETRLGLTTFHTSPALTLERLVLALTAPAGAEGTRPLIPHTEVL